MIYLYTLIFINNTDSYRIQKELFGLGYSWSFLNNEKSQNLCVTDSLSIDTRTKEITYNKGDIYNKVDIYDGNHSILSLTTPEIINDFLNHLYELNQWNTYNDKNPEPEVVTTPHIHIEQIKKWSENTSADVWIRRADEKGKWTKTDGNTPLWSSRFEYFVGVLPPVTAVPKKPEIDVYVNGIKATIVHVANTPDIDDRVVYAIFKKQGVYSDSYFHCRSLYKNFENTNKPSVMFWDKEQAQKLCDTLNLDVFVIQQR